MSNAAKSQIVHESETQRQHVRLPVPVKTELNGKIYTVKNMSSGGVSILNVEGDFPRGARMPLSVKIPFDKFSLNINVEAEVLHYNQKDKTLGCRFLNLTASQLSLFNHILKSFMAGDVIVANDLLSVVSRDNFSKIRKKQDAVPPTTSSKKQIAGLAAVAMMGLTAAVFIGGNIYAGLFTVSATDAMVSAPALEIHAPIAGIFKTELSEGATLLEPGQVIAEITPLPGAKAGPYKPIQVKSPCDCFLLESFRNDGESAKSGEKIISLVPTSSRPWITAEVERLQAAKISLNDRAVFTIAGSQTKFTGHVIDIKSGMTDAQTEDTTGYFSRPVRVRIAPEQKIPPDLVGRPARATFLTN